MQAYLVNPPTTATTHIRMTLAKAAIVVSSLPAAAMAVDAFDRSFVTLSAFPVCNTPHGPQKKRGKGGKVKRW